MKHWPAEITRVHRLAIRRHGAEEVSFFPSEEGARLALARVFDDYARQLDGAWRPAPFVQLGPIDYSITDVDRAAAEEESDAILRTALILEGRSDRTRTTIAFAVEKR